MAALTRLGAIALGAGLAMPAAAQDSVSNAAGLPGDALPPWATAEQINDFVVDLTPFMTSGGTTFGIAPILKASKSATNFFGSLVSAQAISAFTQTGVPFVAPSYSLWGGPGFGVNNDPTINTQPNTIAPPASGVRQGVAFAEFATSDSLEDVNTIIGGVVGFDPANPERLFVRRVVAATSDEDGTQNESQMGFGAVDSNGVVHFRADNFGTTGSNPITGNNYITVQSLLRSATVNAITRVSGVTGGADAGATTVPVNESAVTHNTPGAVDSALAGRPLVIGSNFNMEYVHENAPGVMLATTAHRPSSVDHRGGVHFSSRVIFANSIGTGAMISNPNATDRTNASVWGVDANGAVAGAASVRLPGFPAELKDTSALDPYTFPFDPEFTNYQSQVAFRGGNGQIAVGQDAAGRTLVAGPITGLGFGSNDPEGGIAVGRFDPANPSAVEWSFAAWNALGLSSTFGKGIYDDLGAKIGELATLQEVTGGVPIGPSFSSPAIDAAGNIWFLAAAQLFRGNGQDEMTGETDDDFDTVLLRAVYDPANFTYQLELVLEQGQVFAGQNSQRNWQVRFVSIADSNSIDSATVYSGNMNQTAFAGQPIGTFAADPSDARNLGGFVLQAEIVYDVNMDGDFIKVTGVGGDPASLDQEYNVLLYIGAIPAAPCPADLNGDNTVSGADLGLLLGAWGGPGPADLNGDGTVSGADLGLLLGAWGDCP